MNPLPDPIVFIIRHTIKAGQADEFKQHYRNSLPKTLAGKPGTITQLAYENEDSAEVTVVRVFPDAEALDLHLQGADQRTQKTYEYIELTGIEIFGNPNPSTLEMIRKIAGAGFVIAINPNYLGGFIRQSEAYSS
jgi:quinol monooxygenase YgiN